jgi:hypothetical protein
VGLELVLAGAGAGDGLEEVTGPLGELCRVDTAANKGDVGLGIGVFGELGQSFSGEVLLVWDMSRGADAVA